MKPPFPFLSWMLIPVAAAAGFLGSRRHPGIPAITADKPSPVPTSGARQNSTPIKAGLVSTWTERLANCVAGDLPTLYEEIQQLPEKDDVHRAMLLLYARWVELDATGGLAFFSSIGDKNQRTSCRNGLLTEWAVSDPMAAYAIIAQQPEKEAETDITNIGHALLRADPDKFWIWFRNFRKPLPSTWDSGDLWKRLAADHLEEFTAMAEDLLQEENEAGSGTQKGSAARNSKLEGLHAALASAMAEKDPDKALEWARQLPETVRNKALVAALEVLIKTSPEKLTDHLSLLRDRQVGNNFFIGSGAEELLKKAVGEMIKKDTLGSLDWLRGNQDKLGDFGHTACVQIAQAIAADMRAGKLTPEQAFAVVRAAKEGDGMLRSGILPNMWEGLPPGRLASTAQWLTTIESKETAKLALQGIFPEWVKQDQTAALAFAATLTDRGLAEQMFEAFARRSSLGAVSTQAERMAQTMKLIPPDYRAPILANEVRMNYADGMLEFSAPFDGPAYASALEGMPEGPATDKAFTQIASAWGTMEPEAALAWATGQSDAHLRKTATGAAVEAWAKQDAWGTSQWVDAQPPGETRDTAAHHLARSLRKEEPVSAWTWAGSIGDPATRLEAQAAVLREWRNSSAPDAAAAVEGIADKLGPADHQKLVEALTPPAPAK